MGSSSSNRPTQDAGDDGRPRCSLVPRTSLAQGSNAAVAVLPLGPAYEQPLFELLTAPIPSGIPIKQAHDERNAQIRFFLASLSVLDSRALHKRLSGVSDGDDALVTSFRRLTHERQLGHLMFLADARMRAALAMNRR